MPSCRGGQTRAMVQIGVRREARHHPAVLRDPVFLDDVFDLVHCNPNLHWSLKDSILENGAIGEIDVSERTIEIERITIVDALRIQ